MNDSKYIPAFFNILLSFHFLFLPLLTHRYARLSSVCARLVLVTLVRLSFHRVNAHFLVVLLESRQILASLRELSLLHPLAHVPVYEGPLRVHEVKLVVKAGPGLRDGRRVAQHAHRPLDLGEVSARDDGRRLVVDANLQQEKNVKGRT